MSKNIMKIMFRYKNVMKNNSRSLNKLTLVILLITIFGNMSVMNIVCMTENFRNTFFKRNDHSDNKSVGITISGKKL